jgi:tRNA threonylcarbamoyladenosine biosynthesis protein TsaB
MGNMLILAIDTALGAVSACAYDSQADHVVASERILLDRGHAEALVPLLERLAAEIPGRFSVIDRVAVTTGPGSFTGIRVGVAAARSIGTACDIEVVGVSTLQAFAAPLLGSENVNVASVIDARHGNVFFECFDHKGSITHEAAVLSVRDAAALLHPGLTLLTGPGATLVAIEAWSQGRQAEVAGDFVSPPIDFVARLAAFSDSQESPPQPFYLKAADVTPRATTLPRVTT